MNQRIVLTLVDCGGEGPYAIRLRRLIKLMLRVFGFRCVDVREVTK